ncbi:Hypothetical protein NTJ_06104 [Nesidiocoris tenuis]|uniref:Ionotropic glutamate receptor C-terminal domain-containing protein n=1 Tax=Nesidiocoris tenuis TaxID=355587 RepID=A0ABN7AM33_9HEMI|nr:Hypothetical protein NTJ_06104 [Nesidiocoris tenuis]
MTWNSSHGLEMLKDPGPKLLPGVTVRGSISLKDSRTRNDELLQTLEDVDREFVDDNLMKFSFVLHNLLKTVYNFDWELHLTGLESVHRVYATVNGSINYDMNGTQFGSLSNLSDDVGLYPAEFLPSGLDTFEYLPPLLKFRQAFVFSSPQTYLEPYVLYTQFSGSVWGVSLCLALIATFVASFSLKTIYPENCEEHNEASVPSSVLVVVGAFAQQGLGKTYDSISLRIAHLSLLILTTLLYMFYNTGLLIYMLNPSQKEVRSFPELADKKETIAAHDTPYNRYQLGGNYSRPTEWFYHNCETESEGCRVNIEYYDLETGGGKIKNENAAYFGYVSNVYGILDDMTSDREKIDLREVAVHKPFLVGTFVRKNFLFKEQFFRGLLLLREAGILCHEDRKWNAKKPAPIAEPNFVSASLYSTNVAFGVLFVGLALSILTVAFEICATRYRISRIEIRSKHHGIES